MSSRLAHHDLLTSTDTSTYLQQIPLGGGFTSLTGGTFPWLVDLPAGLSVQVQFCERERTRLLILFCSSIV